MRESTNLTRRSFLELTGTGSLAWALGAELRGAARVPIAVQLYSVRGDCTPRTSTPPSSRWPPWDSRASSSPATTTTREGARARKRLDSLKLEGGRHAHPAGHAARRALKPTIDFHQAIGCRFLVVPGNTDFTDPEKSKALADTFNELAATLKPLGMACGYHNHTDEFKKDGDKTFWDLFAERTTKDVILQQDCGWTFAAGFDPVAYVKKYPGRTKTTHFKPTVREGETAKKAILGQDSVDWAAVYAACTSVGGTEWIVVEQETYPDGKTADGVHAGVARGAEGADQVGIGIRNCGFEIGDQAAGGRRQAGDSRAQGLRLFVPALRPPPSAFLTSEGALCNRPQAGTHRSSRSWPSSASPSASSSSARSPWSTRRR